jgi:hypothetical protein
MASGMRRSLREVIRPLAGDVNVPLDAVKGSQQPASIVEKVEKRRQRLKSPRKLTP